MNTTSIKKTKAFRVRMPDGSIQTVITTGERRGLGGVEEVIVIVACPCGNVLHDISKVAAFCGVCDAALCAGCGEEKCSLCGKSTCVEHRTKRYAGDPCCISHGLLQRLLP